MLANNELAKSAKLPKKAMEQTIFVGRSDNPVAFIKRNEIKDYLDQEFFKLHQIWENYHNNMGLPIWGKSWAEHPQWMIEAIQVFEREYKYMTSKR